MEALAKNGQMGISCLWGNGVFLKPSNHYPPQRFAVPQRPTSRFPSIPSMPSRIRAMQAREQEGNPVASNILEKDLSFKPTFSDYVKILETVKENRATDRPCSDGVGSSRTSRPSWTGRGDDEAKDGVNGGRRSSNVRDKDRLVKGDGARVKSNAPRGSSGLVDNSDLIGSKDCKRWRRHGGDRGEAYPSSREDVSSSERSYGGKKSEQKASKRCSGSNRTVEDGRQGSIFGRGSVKERVGRSIVSRSGSNGSAGGLTTQDWGKKGRELVGGRSSRSISASTEVGRGLWEKNANATDVEDDGVMDDRAAFKTFEVFTDVRNRPRVLRMEMEQRIRNLAKWLNATDVNMPEWQFSRMMHSAKIKFTDHSILRVIQILGEFGNWRRVLQVVEWFRSRERFKSYKSRYIYTAALDVLGTAKRPMEALNIFYAMREEKSSYPDLAAYHCIAVTLGRAGLMKELFDVIDCMKSLPKKKFNLGLDKKWNPQLEPDLVVYNAVLNACAEKRQWEGAFWVLQQLGQQGIRPSGTTYGLVMEVMLACEKYDLVYEFFKKVEKTSIPCTLSYKVLVNAFWREGKIDEAVSAVENMEKRGIVGSASLYYDLARCLCSAGRCQNALAQMDKICKVATKPLVVTYTGLIQSCVASGNVKDGEYIYNEMQKFCSPNTITCNIMLKAYLENKMYEEAMAFFQKLLRDSQCINQKSDLKGKAIPDKFTFNAMIKASSAANKWDDFEHAFIQMLHRGFHFDKKRHLRMVMDAARAGKGELLDRIWDHLVRSGREPPLPIVKEMFCMKLGEGNHASALSCLQAQSHEDSNAYSVQSWLNLLKSNANNLTTQTIVELIREIGKIDAETDSLQPIYQNVLDACSKFLGPGTKGSEHPDDHMLFSAVHP